MSVNFCDIMINLKNDKPTSRYNWAPMHAYIVVYVRLICCIPRIPRAISHGFPSGKLEIFGPDVNFSVYTDYMVEIKVYRYFRVLDYSSFKTEITLI